MTFPTITNFPQVALGIWMGVQAILSTARGVVEQQRQQQQQQQQQQSTDDESLLTQKRIHTALQRAGLLEQLVLQQKDEIVMKDEELRALSLSGQWVQFNDNNNNNDNNEPTSVMMMMNVRQSTQSILPLSNNHNNNNHHEQPYSLSLQPSTTTTTNDNKEENTMPQKAIHIQGTYRDGGNHTATTVKSWAVNYFDRLKKKDSPNHQDHHHNNNNWKVLNSNSKGSARTGGIFLQSTNHRFIIKTIKPAERDHLLRILPLYMDHVVDHSPHSFLSRLYGMYTLEEEQHNHHKQPFHNNNNRMTVLVMNVACNDPEITIRYDLKGSTRGRTSTTSPWKDLDWLDDKDKEQPQPLALTRKNKRTMAVWKQLLADVALLEQCGVIDYSLLLGLGIPVRPSIRMLLQYLLFPGWFWTTGPAQGSSFSRRQQRRRRRMRQTLYQKPYNYHFGIIDFLQPFSSSKMAEYAYKGLVQQQKQQSYSCVPPVAYARRFRTFLAQHVFTGMMTPPPPQESDNVTTTFSAQA